MKFIVDVEFSDVLLAEAAEYGSRFTEQDRIHYLEDKIEDGLEGGYYDSVTATALVEVGPDKFIAEPSYVELVRQALEATTPNAPEDWDDEAIQELANYLAANDYAEEDLVDPSSLIYTMYDLTKWTLGNK